MAQEKMNIDQLREMVGKGGQQRASGAVKLEDDGSVRLIATTMQALQKELAQEFKPAIAEVIDSTTAEQFDTLRKGVEQEVENLRKQSEIARPIVVKQGRKTKRLDGVQHNQFENLLKAVASEQAVLLVGPAGTGKTHGAEAVAKALDLTFYSISVGSQTSKSDLQGYRTATGDYIETQFRLAYEHGGLFLLDEADAGNSNVLILLNAALSNGYMAFPDKMVQRHKDFRLVATANTFGHGASRQYVGRNQLDAATLDRFVTIFWGIDERIETALAGTQKVWLNVVRAVRQRAVEELELRVVISPRATQRGAVLLEAGLGFDTVLEMALIGNITTEKAQLERLAKDTWAKGNK